MRLRIDRYALDEKSTIGFLWEVGSWGAQHLICTTLEDRVRRPGEKVDDATAIPEGSYKVELRRGSPMANDYDERYKHFSHDGMLWLRNVPGFEWVYLHTGNTPDHSSGCILVGRGVDLHKRTITQSRLAYEEIYPWLYGYANNGKLIIDVGYSQDLTRRHKRHWERQEDR